MGSQATVDIMIPAFNAAATLRATLRSVRLQTLPLNSVTVVDDGSTDNTADIAREFDGIRYVRNERNMGCAGNWNRCLDLARADFVCLLHSDDLLVPHWHERLQADIRLAESPLDTAYYLGAARFEDRGGIIEAFSFSDRPGLYAPGLLLKLLWGRQFYGLTTSACTVYGRNVLARLGRFPGDLFPNMADVPFHWALSLDHSIVYDPELMVLIRRGAPNQVGRTRRAELAIGAFRAYAPVASRIAGALGQTEARTTVEYLFPYGALAILGMTRGKNEVPDVVSNAFRTALSQCPKSVVLVVAIRELAERMRRGRIRRRWARTVVGIREAAEGIQHVAQAGSEGLSMSRIERKEQGGGHETR